MSPLTLDEVKKFLENRLSSGRIGRLPNKIKKWIDVEMSWVEDISPTLYAPEIQSAKYYAMLYSYSSVDDVPLCPSCGENPAQFDRRSKLFAVACSEDCHRSKVREAWESNGGHPMHREEIKELVLEKREKTWNKNGGCPLVRPKIREAVSSNLFDKYGVRSHKQIHLSGETFELLDDPVRLRSMYEEFGASELARMLGCSTHIIYDRLTEYGTPADCFGSHSFEESSLLQFVSEIFPDVVRSDRKVLEGKEIDILIPSIGVGIEYNGIYWHSTEWGRGEFYHIQKTSESDAKGIRLIHVFSDEWQDNREETEGKLRRCLSGELLNSGSEVFVDLNWERVRDYEAMGYHVVKEYGPSFDFVVNGTRSANGPTDGPKIYDCGKVLMKKPLK